MNQETRNCQNCKNQFVIEPEDFEFYEKIKVPPPTWCPECRMVRRFLFGNERALFHRKEDRSGKEIISIFRQDSPFPVYAQSDWWSDDWDPMAYGTDFKEDAPLLSQLRDLMNIVPRAALLNIACVDCHYCAKASYSKNCYFNLSFAAENCMYGHYGRNVRDSLDYLFLIDCERCYKCVYCRECANLKYSAYSNSCRDSAFLLDCRNCNDCFGCVGLRNKRFYIFNQPFTKEDYEAKMKELHLGSHQSLEKIRRQVAEVWARHPRKFANIQRCENVTGDRIHGSKNSFFCFDVDPLEYATENCKFFVTGTNASDSYDVGETGEGSERCYEMFEGWGSDIRFSSHVIKCRNIEYSLDCHDSSDLFACVGLRKKQYCILNRQYGKSEYEEMRKKIVAHMDARPYVDNHGRTYTYGEFFPPELSAFAYNESVAFEFFPSEKNQVEALGFMWREPDVTDHVVTKQVNVLPDDIQGVDDSIVHEVIECEHRKTCNDRCAGAFKIIPQELAFYQRHAIPLPRLCPNCRHRERAKLRSPLKLWHRQCMCELTTHQHQGKCPTEFETSYPPERPEIIYCESCYNAEVA